MRLHRFFEYPEIGFPGLSEVNRPDETTGQELNTPAEIGRGVIKTDKNKSKEFTILLVGETGTGKTSLLSLLGNIVHGHKPEQFVNFNDKEIEFGHGQRNSQTTKVKTYQFTSINGVKLTILDTPGLADTRGLAQDELHKANIAKAIKEGITTVDAIIILANGTLPRLGIATDYALSTLSSIFPRTLASNIGILFTNVSNPLSWNFDQKSLPDVLRDRDDHQWFLDNPIAMWNKYLQIKAYPNISKKVLRALLSAVNDGHQRALAEISSIFDWLDGLKPQSTNDIMNLYEQSQQINRIVESAVLRAVKISSKKDKAAQLKQLVNEQALIMKQNENFRSVIQSKVWVQESTSHHNTLCSQPNCYSNCHISCHELRFSMDPNALVNCRAMGGDKICRQCRHPYASHRHYNSLWKQQDHRQENINRDAEAKYSKAKREKNAHDTMVIDLDKVIRNLDSEQEKTYTSLGRLMESYAKLSLSGSFVGQVQKSVRLLETSLEAMRNSGADIGSIMMIEKNLDNMRLKLEVVEAAEER